MPIGNEHAKDKLISPVDPDARTGKKTSTKWAGYKAHIVMEEESGIITEVATTPANATDGSQLRPLLKEQEKVHSLTPQELTADKAYDWGENLESLAAKNTIANIALTKQVNRRTGVDFAVDDFLYDPENIKLMCPAGHISTNCYSEVLYNYQLNKPGYAFRFKAESMQCVPVESQMREEQGGQKGLHQLLRAVLQNGKGKAGDRGRERSLP